MGVDTSIYNMLGRGVKSVADYDREAAEGQQNMLALQGQRMKMDEMQRGVQRQRNLLSLSSGWNADTTDDQRISAYKNAGYFDEADKLEKTLLERQKTGAEVMDKTSQAKTRDYALKRSMLEHGIQSLQASRTPQDAAAEVQAGVAKGYWSMEDATKKLSAIPRDQGQFEQWRADQLRRVLAAEKQLPKIETRNLGGTTQTAAIDPFTGAVNVTGSAANTQSPDSVASNALGWANNRIARDRLKFDQEQPKGTYDPARGVIVDTRAGTAAPVTMPGGAPLPASKPVNMSPTMQKEVFEADDTVQSGRAVINILEQASKLNADAYSGYLAKPRAVLRSNMPGESAAADATINLDNMMTGQALESLKLVFGGMPTEGERKILLEMQASADKTPGQRKEIIDRAIKAAKTRVAFNEKKAKALRDGTYMTQGVPDDTAPPDAPAAGPKRITSDAEFNALPSGTEFIAPDGSRRRKP